MTTTRRSHADCTHPATPAARAACRKVATQPIAQGSTVAEAALDDATRARFDAILDLEHQTQITKNLAGFIVGDGLAAKRREQAKLFAAIEALTPAEAAAFGQYRKGL